MTPYAWGVGFILFVVGLWALVVSARGLRRRLMPDWRGPNAVLAASVLGVTVLVGTGLALGTFGLFRRGPMVVALVLAAWLADPAWSPWRVDRPVEAPATDAARARGGGSDATWLARVAAATGVAVVATTWLAHVVAVYRRGSSDGDSLMYHLPFATEFVQTGWTSRIMAVSPDAWVAFYPANVELVEGAAMLPFRHQALFPLLNLGWLALMLLAGWCLGAVAGRGPLGLLMAAVVVSLPIMASTQAGTARIDVAVIALVLAAVALLFAEPRTPWSCATAGMALGLAAGSKFVVLPLAGLLLVTVAVALWRRHGVRYAAAWGAAAALCGGYWYVRNWAVAGSPVPVAELKVGPVGFAALPHERLAALDGTSILDKMHLPGFGSQTLLPAVDAVTGALPFALLLGLAACMAALLVVRGRPVGVPHAVVTSAVVACLVYVISPNGAPIWGTDIPGNVDAMIVSLNARYLLPGFTVLLCLLAVALEQRWRRLADVVAVGTVGYLLFLATRPPPGHVEWAVYGVDTATAIAVVAVIGGAVAISRVVAVKAGAAARPFAPFGIAACALLVAVVAGGSAIAGSSGLERYEGYEGPAPDVVALWRTAERLSDRRIGIVGAPLLSPYTGSNLANRVEYVGLPQGRGLSQPPRTCNELRRSVAAARYDIVVVQRDIFDLTPGPQQHVGCLTSSPGAELLFADTAGAIVRM